MIPLLRGLLVFLTNISSDTAFLLQNIFPHLCQVQQQLKPPASELI